MKYKICIKLKDEKNINKARLIRSGFLFVNIVDNLLNFAG